MPIDVTERSSIEVRALEAKAFEPMDVTEADRRIEVSPLEAKALEPMDKTLAGMLIVLSEEQPLNAESAMATSPSG